MTWIVVALAGGFGAAARYWVDEVVGTRFGPGNGRGTFAVNVSGSLLAGVVAGLLVNATSAHPASGMVVAGGFLGAYTTFSTAMLQVAERLRSRPGIALADLVGSLAVGVAAAAAGLVLVT